MAQVKINLLTKEFQGSGPSPLEGVARWILIGGLVGILIIGGSQYINLFNLEGEQRDLQTTSAALNASVTRVQKMKALEDGVTRAANMIKGIHTSSLSGADLLAGISNNVPGGVSVQSLAIAGGAVSVNLSAGNFLQVEQYVDSLRENKNLSGIQLSSLVLGDSGDGGSTVKAVVSINYGKVANGK